MTLSFAQKQAADPRQTIFVTASAGTGKTTVLIRRVLRILLGDNDGVGTPPHKILCITFTKAAAAEMYQRLADAMAQWSVMEDGALSLVLADLIDAVPQHAVMARARRLLQEALDTPGGLKIQTIHGFCQSLLARFPLEAGIAPHSRAVEAAESNALRIQALQDVMRNHHYAGLIESIAAKVDYSLFEDSVMTLVQQGYVFAPDHIQQVSDYFALPVGITADGILAQAIEDTAFDKDGLLRAATALATGSDKEKKRAATIFQWLEHADTRLQTLDDYRQVFLRKDNHVLATLANKPTLKQYPECERILSNEAERLATLFKTIDIIGCVHMTASILPLAGAVRAAYQQAKQRRSILDYDDLIDYTAALMQSPHVAQWVLYKLDGGIDHILVDEAQDTNPKQWAIIRALANEFFTGLSARSAAMRSLFAVGDAKQSIYSFQGSEPASFVAAKLAVEQQAKDGGILFQHIHLQDSYRSTQAVLQVVDSVFAQPIAKGGVVWDDQPIHHSVARMGQAGRVELWPLAQSKKIMIDAPWQWQQERSVSALQTLADRIAGTIAGWLQNGDQLPSAGRPIRAGDILILVRKRTGGIVDALVRSLKRHHVLVAGADRMYLTDHLAVQDIAALLKFLLLPDDDLNCATLLKTPLIGLDDDALFGLAHHRLGLSVWQRLQESKNHESIAAYLSALLARADFVSPYDMIRDVLQSPCPADSLSGLRALAARLSLDVYDPLEEVLNFAMKYSEDKAATLQGFIACLENSPEEIKRDFTASDDDAVKIMTVHGAKGLEAPIVIMPDTISVPWKGSKAAPKLFWPKGQGVGAPVWQPYKIDAPLFNDGRNRAMHEQQDEYRRLLYVAMTRARDRLIVTGWHKPRADSEKSQPDPLCWYHLVESGLHETGGAWQQSDDVWVVDNAQTRLGDGKKQSLAVANTPVIADILYQPLAAPALPLQIITPSQIAGGDHLQTASLLDDDGWPLLRGRLLHRLLQSLPAVPLESRMAAAARFLAAQNISPQQSDALLQSVFAVLDNPDFGFLFSATSVAEQAVAAYVEGTKIVGQIDRLVVQGDGVWIVDYKTNDPVPAVPPAAYLRQMAAYRAAIQPIYPDKTIHLALLWTASPSLQIITDMA